MQLYSLKLLLHYFMSFICKWSSNLKQDVELQVNKLNLINPSGGLSHLYLIKVNARLRGSQYINKKHILLTDLSLAALRVS